MDEVDHQGSGAEHSSATGAQELSTPACLCTVTSLPPCTKSSAPFKERWNVLPGFPSPGIETASEYLIICYFIPIARPLYRLKKASGKHQHKH